MQRPCPENGKEASLAGVEQRTRRRRGENELREVMGNQITEMLWAVVKSLWHSL